MHIDNTDLILPVYVIYALYTSLYQLMSSVFGNNYQRDVVISYAIKHQPYCRHLYISYYRDALCNEVHTYVMWHTCSFQKVDPCNITSIKSSIIFPIKQAGSPYIHTGLTWINISFSVPMQWGPWIQGCHLTTGIQSLTRTYGHLALLPMEQMKPCQTLWMLIRITLVWDRMGGVTQSLSPQSICNSHANVICI